MAPAAQDDTALYAGAGVAALALLAGGAMAVRRKAAVRA
jgi:hypothetical protein